MVKQPLYRQEFQVIYSQHFLFIQEFTHKNQPPTESEAEPGRRVHTQ